MVRTRARRHGGCSGLPTDQAAPYTIDLQQTLSVAGNLPQAGETRMTFSNNHLQYAFTWAGLALTLVGVYLAFLIKAWRDQAGLPLALKMMRKTMTLMLKKKNAKQPDSRRSPTQPAPNGDNS